MFDFAAAEKAASKDAKPKPLIAAVTLGTTRAGKSYVSGTMPGKILFLYTQGEEHGKHSARLPGGNVVPIAVDIDDSGHVLGADSAYKRLITILQDASGLSKAGFNSVVLDGLTELEQLIRTTSQWALACRAKSGEHNGFAEPAATLAMIRPVMDALRTLQRQHGTHYLVTCLLMIKETAEDGEILASEPKLCGYEVAAQLIPQFPDQILVGPMLNEKGAKAHRLQFGGKVSKSSRDQKTGALKKQIGFAPCLQGVPSDSLPDTMKADMAAVITLKTECIEAIGKPKAKAKKEEPAA